MSKKKVTLVIDGHSDDVELAIHELNKMKDQANQQKGMSVSIQTKELDDNNYTSEFTNNHE